MAKAKRMTSRQVGLTYGFRSGLEESVAAQLEAAGINPKFESVKLPFEEHKKRTYTPDFPVSDRIIIETKGRFLTADRMKMLEVQRQYPNLEFRFIFTNSRQRISKVSATTYAKWCEKNGFKYADKVVPQEWIEEIKKINNESSTSTL